MIDNRSQSRAAFERLEEYVSYLLSALKPFSDAADYANAKNAAAAPNDRHYYAREQVEEAAFGEAFAAYTERLNPDDFDAILAALERASPAVDGAREVAHSIIEALLVDRPAKIDVDAVLPIITAALASRDSKLEGVEADLREYKEAHDYWEQRAIAAESRLAQAQETLRYYAGLGDSPLLPAGEPKIGDRAKATLAAIAQPNGEVAKSACRIGSCETLIEGGACKPECLPAPPVSDGEKG